MEGCEIIINNNKIKVIKNVYHIYNHDTDISREKKKKIVYTISDISIYNDIPQIIEIENKKFYKSDITKINQKDFKLIEC